MLLWITRGTKPIQAIDCTVGNYTKGVPVKLEVTAQDVSTSAGPMARQVAHLCGDCIDSSLCTSYHFRA